MGEIIQGDCLEVMRGMEANSISAIVTDPPYGLSFMGKGWDYEVPQVSYWKEALRVSKPGSFLISMGGTRTFHRLTCAIEDAGWEIRDCISWLYGSGFPKSHNHFGIEGYGTALKPAWEPCIVAMKPCEGTFAQNAQKWGQAGINIDGCRIPVSKSDPNHRPNPTSNGHTSMFSNIGGKGTGEVGKNGRWPANVMFDEEAAAMLDEQSGIGGSSKRVIGGSPRASGSAGHILQGSRDRSTALMNYGDSGGASRFFYCAKTSSRERDAGLDGLPDRENVFKKDLSTMNDLRMDGEQQRLPKKNHHPTVKPLRLMEYLIKLVMPPKDGILLDPFAGSGSTIVAAERLGLRGIGIEKQAEYADIARARLVNGAKRIESAQLDLFDQFKS